MPYRPSHHQLKSSGDQPSASKSHAMYRFVVILVVLVTISVCTAQLNFSTGWGKRVPGGGSPGAPENNCKASIDTLMLIYKLIQTEAQKLQECEKFAN